MIDLHSHILPGIDDGTKDLEQAVELARVAVADGIQVMAATPHLREDFPGVDVYEIAPRCGQLNAALRDRGIPLEVVPGAEVDVVWAYEASDEELRMATYGQAGRDLLLESPFGMLPPTFETFLFERLATRGIRVILAHPERCMGFRERPERLEALVQRGVLVQLTGSSLAAPRKSRTRRLARALIEAGLAHVIASDTHRPADFRPPTLSLGMNAASEIDPDRARWMVTDAPQAILNSSALPPMPPIKRSRRVTRLMSGLPRS